MLIRRCTPAAELLCNFNIISNSFSRFHKIFYVIFLKIRNSSGGEVTHAKTVKGETLLDIIQGNKTEFSRNCIASVCTKFNIWIKEADILIYGLGERDLPLKFGLLGNPGKTKTRISRCWMGNLA